MWRVYPRVCGGTYREAADSVEAAGLSPRVRGNQDAAVAMATTTRSIPACAGEPAVDGQSRYDSEVYPRVCGGTPM